MMKNKEDCKMNFMVKFIANYLKNNDLSRHKNKNGGM